MDRPVDHLAELRRSYLLGSLTEADVDRDPVVQLGRWLVEAQEAGLVEPNAMVLATVDDDGLPAARTVLLKGLDARGLTFFTQRRSAKARQLLGHPHGALVFPWHGMDRQAIVRGSVHEVDRTETAEYFASRPRGNQLAAWASEQSSVVADRAALESAYAEVDRQWAGRDVDLPDSWTGFRLVPVTVELWQGRRDRLHDRLRYRREGAGWALERLAP